MEDTKKFAVWAVFKKSLKNTFSFLPKMFLFVLVALLPFTLFLNLYPLSQPLLVAGLVSKVLVMSLLGVFLYYICFNFVTGEEVSFADIASPVFLMRAVKLFGASLVVMLIVMPLNMLLMGFGAGSGYLIYLLLTKYALAFNVYLIWLAIAVLFVLGFASLLSFVRVASVTCFIGAFASILILSKGIAVVAAYKQAYKMVIEHANKTAAILLKAVLLLMFIGICVMLGMIPLFMIVGLLVQYAGFPLWIAPTFSEVIQISFYNVLMTIFFIRMFFVFEGKATPAAAYTFTKEDVAEVDSVSNE